MRAVTGIFSLSVALVIAATSASAESWLATGDRLALDDAAQDGLEYGPVDEPVPWVNPDTGNGGTFTPTATYQDSGNVCREYTVAATIGGRDEQVWGIACRQPDGSWREASADPPPAQPATTPSP